MLLLALAHAVAGDPACDLSRCPPGHEARICAGDFEGRGDCPALEQAGWARACTAEDRDKAWRLVVCKAPPASPLTCGCSPGQNSPVWMPLLFGMLTLRRSKLGAA